MDESKTDDECILEMLEDGDSGLIDQLAERSNSLGFGSPIGGRPSLGRFGGELWIDGGSLVGWRDKKPFELDRRSEFSAERFDLVEKRTGLGRVLGKRRIRSGVAVWFRHATDPLRPNDRWLCGWVPCEREDGAMGWARQLNRLIQKNLDEAGVPPLVAESATATAPVSGFSLGELSELKPLFKALVGTTEPTTTTAIGTAGPRVRIVRHEAGRQRYASLITDGLQHLGREELVLTLPDHVLNKTPSTPADVLKAICAALDNARPLQPGALLAARHPAWPRVAGFVVERAPPMNGVDLPPGCLALHALVDEELAAADIMGPLRVIARLTRRVGAWPPPASCDPWRSAVATPTERSVLREVTTAHVPGVTVALEVERSTLVVRVSRSALPMLADLDVRTDFALFASLADRADALFSWEPGDTFVHVNAGGRSSAKRIAGCFFAVSSKARTDAIGPIEDGFSALLTEASAAELGAALLRGQPFALSPTHSLGLVLQWEGELA